MIYLIEVMRFLNRNRNTGLCVLLYNYYGMANYNDTISATYRNV